MVLHLGACPEYGCLLYEYMNNGPPPWPKLFEIAAEIVTALLFLHQTKPGPLVHRDLKPANILLDKKFVSKISDVGLARLVPPPVADSVIQYYMTAAAGTFCYIDPEYQQTGKLTTKSNIYLLGIMLLQPVEEALAFAKLALKCAELGKKDRPNLASVVVPELNCLRDFGYTLHNNQTKNRSHSPRSPTLTRTSHSMT